MSEDTKPIKRPDKSILDVFYKLPNKDADRRITAAQSLLRILHRKQKEVEDESELCADLNYTIDRLIKGLASDREAARLGFALVLTQILKEFDVLQVSSVIETIKKHITLQPKYVKDKRDFVFAQLFSCSALVRSGRLKEPEHILEVVMLLHDLSFGRNYIINSSYEIFKELLCQMLEEDFKANIWPQLKKKMPKSWEENTANNFWFLLLCSRLFPTVISKYTKKNWNIEDIFSQDNFAHLKLMIKQTSSVLPSLHPFCIEFILSTKGRSDMKEIWKSLISENLFENTYGEKAYVGFKIVQQVLETTTKKKVVKTILSPEFTNIFSDCFLRKKHVMHAAALQLAAFFGNYVKTCENPEIQMIILKSLLQKPGIILSVDALHKKEVTQIIQDLKPEAIKSFCEMLKSIVVGDDTTDSDDAEFGAANCRVSATAQIGSIICHSTMASDFEWKLCVVKFLFLHSFFGVKKASPDILHAEEVPALLFETIRATCSANFFKSLYSLQGRGDKHAKFLASLLDILDYAEQLLDSSENVSPLFPMEKVQATWKKIRSVVTKLTMKGKKDGKANESRIFQLIFCQLALFLFAEPDSISEVFEELHVCYKKALKSKKKHDEKEDKNDPPWICVIVDVILSILSKPSAGLKRFVMSIFPHLCPYMNDQTLEQIFDVINPEKASEESMLVDESDDENEDAEFMSGTSSEENENDDADEEVDEEFKQKIKDTLGAAADVSDAESVVLSDSEMFKLDASLAKAFNSRKIIGHTKLTSEAKAMLDFRSRCLELVTVFVKSEPPIEFVLQCVEPILACYEFGCKNRHQSPLSQKALSTLECITQFKGPVNGVEMSKFEDLLETLIGKCHKDAYMTAAKKVYPLCIFMVLCCRKLEAQKSSSKKAKKDKLPCYLQKYMTTLDTFIKKPNSSISPELFVLFINRCPDLAWHFVDVCQAAAFDDKYRMYRRAQCLCLLLEAVRFSRNQPRVTTEQWLQFGESILPVAVESLKNLLKSEKVATLYLLDLLNTIHTVQAVVKEKTDQSLIDDHQELVPLLNEMTMKQLKSRRGKKLRFAIITSLGGTVVKRQEPEAHNDADSSEVAEMQPPAKKKKAKNV